MGFNVQRLRLSEVPSNKLLLQKIEISQIFLAHYLALIWGIILHIRTNTVGQKLGEILLQTFSGAEWNESPGRNYRLWGGISGSGAKSSNLRGLNDLARRRAVVSLKTDITDREIGILCEAICPRPPFLLSALNCAVCIPPAFLFNQKRH